MNSSQSKYFIRLGLQMYKDLRNELNNFFFIYMICDIILKVYESSFKKHKITTLSDEALNNSRKQRTIIPDL